MPTRPILDQNLTSAATPSSVKNESAPAAMPDSPLASQLPAWDLIPAHTLLVRRRFVSSKKPQTPPATVNEPPLLPSSAKIPATSPVPVKEQQPAATQANELPKLPETLQQTPVAAPISAAAASVCKKCGAHLVEGSVFCTECGTKQD